MRRLLIFAATFAFLVLASPARRAQATEVGYGRNFGLGISLGDPTGFTGKYWVGPTNAIDFGIGFLSYGWGDRCYTDSNQVQHCWGYSAYDFIGDYLWQSNIVRGAAQLDWHIGAGAKVVTSNQFDYDYGSHGWNFGPRGVIGLDLMFQQPSFLEVYVELAPVLYLFGPDFEIDAALGARFYF